MQSMTGYGFFEIQRGEDHLQVEVRSVNNRYQEIRIHLPEPSHQWEILLTGLVKERIQRGRVDLHLFYNRNLSSYSIKPDLQLAKEYLCAWKTLYHGLGIKGEIRIDTLLKKEEIFKKEKQVLHSEGLEEMIREAANKALEDLLTMRREEGEILKGELLQVVKELERLKEEMRERTPLIVEAYQKRLSGRLENLLQGRGDLICEDRLSFEVATMAERSDITEELTRVGSHLRQLEETLSLEDELQGRKIDFIAQELNREVNTIGSKAGDMEISSKVIDMKSQIDRIREQAKNIQ